MNEADKSNEERPANQEPEDELSVIDLLIVLAKHKLLILGLPFVVAVMAAGYSLTLPFIYTANTKILVPAGQSSSTSAMLAQLGGLTGLANTVGGFRNPNDIYIGMLKSRTVADNLIQRFGLMKIYQAQIPSRARLRLAAASSIAAGKDNIITIDVEDENPKLAAEIANAYVDELFKLTRVLAVTEASQRRLFFERQFEQARANLTKAEVNAREALEKGGLVQVEGQGRAMVEASARLRGQITVKEVQIGSMRTFATDRNPDLQLAQKELEALKSQLARAEGTAGIKGNDQLGNTGNGIDSLRLLRDVKYFETIYELLAKQFELAKIDEAKDSAVIQIIDKAIEPDFRSKPKRGVIVVLSALVALVISVLAAFVWEGIAKASGDPRQASQLRNLKSYLVWKSRRAIDQ